MNTKMPRVRGAAEPHQMKQRCKNMRPTSGRRDNNLEVAILRKRKKERPKNPKKGSAHNAREERGGGGRPTNDAERRNEK